MKKAFAEFGGTFIIVFFGTGAIIFNDTHHQSLGIAGIPCAFGLAVFLAILLFGNISGAHLNPAVSLALAYSKTFPISSLLSYVTMQIAGAISASFLLLYFAPSESSLGNTLPSGTSTESFLLEFFLSFLLMIVIWCTSLIKKQKLFRSALFIGLCVGMQALLAGPICGASMNPARSLAPALVSGNLESLWIYLTAPPLGALIATFVFKKWSK